jgi:hypothetical protein
MYQSSKKESLPLRVLPGSNITNTIADAIRLAGCKTCPVRFAFNGVTVTVAGDSTPDLIYRDWSRAMNDYIPKDVGPYPAPALTEKEKAHDAHIEAKNERRRQKAERKWEAAANAKRKATERKLRRAPAIELSDEAGWLKFKENNKDGYGGAVVSYSERWARLMQAEMGTGKNLEDVAEATSGEADIEGITGFMYGCAVSTLAQCWKHGDRLRRWHNLRTQIRDEGEKANAAGGVLNPALLRFG